MKIDLKVLLPFFLGLCAATALAQSPPEMMDPVRVEDEGDDEATVVSDTQLEQSQARDLEDTFRDTPEVVVGGSTRTAQKVYLRGLEDTNLNVTVDGARQSGYLFHHQGRLNVDTELLKKVELDAGSGSALSGPGALGGAIRFVTKDAEDLLMSGQSYGALVKGKYSTNNDEKGATLALFAKPADSWSTLAFVTLSEAGNQRTGGDGETIPYTSGKPKAMLAKVTARPAAGHKITLSSNYTEDNAQRLVRANFGYTGTAPITDKVLETLNTTLNYEMKPGTDGVDFTATLYDARSKMQNSSGTGSTAAMMDSNGLTVSNKFKTGGGSFTLGADAHQDVAKAARTNVERTEKGTILGVFGQWAHDFTSDWRLTTGLRFDDYKLTSVGGEKFAADHLSPSAALRYRWNEFFASSLSWAQAFRGPVSAEILLLANSTTAAPSPELKGTISETTEFTTTFKESKLDALTAKLFSTDLIDPLDSSITAGQVVRVNVADRVTIRGYELKYKRTIENVDASVFYTHSQTKYAGQNLGYSSSGRGISLGDRAGFNADLRLPERDAVLSWTSTLVMELNDVPAGRAAQPGYDVHSVGATWLPTDRFKTGVSVQNLFDRKYVAQGSVYTNGSGAENFLYETGRDLRFFASYIF